MHDDGPQPTLPDPGMSEDGSNMSIRVGNVRINADEMPPYVHDHKAGWWHTFTASLLLVGALIGFVDLASYERGWLSFLIGAGTGLCCFYMPWFTVRAARIKVAADEVARTQHAMALHELIQRKIRAEYRE